MVNSKTYQIISQFDQKTRNSLELFLSSPYQNTNYKVLELFKLINRNWKSQRLSKHILFKTVYRHEAYNDDKFRLLNSRLYQKTLEFVAMEAFKNDEKNPVYTIKGLHNLNLPQHFLQQKKKYQKSNPKSSEELLLNLRTEEESFEFMSSISSRQATTNLQELSLSIDNYFLFQKLKYSCELLNRKQILDKEYDFTFLEILIQYLHQNPPEHKPTNLYFQLLLLVRDQEERQFKTLKKKLTQESHHVDIEELRNMYVFLMNFCVKKINQNVDQYYVELFDIYKILLEKEIITQGDTLSLGDFKNIATVALRLNELNWVDQFTDVYSKFIPEKSRTSANSYNKARINFHKKDYKSALRYLTTVEYNDVYFQLGSRSLLLKIYYEQDELDLFPAVMQSLRVYLTRTKEVSDYQKGLYLNYLKIIKQLFRFKGGNKRGLKELLHSLKSQSNVVDLEWLKVKADELI